MIQHGRVQQGPYLKLLTMILKMPKTIKILHNLWQKLDAVDNLFRLKMDVVKVACEKLYGYPGLKNEPLNFEEKKQENFNLT